MVSRPLQIATVGETTFSITRPNGSVTPVDKSCSRVSISGSNLLKRSVNSCCLELFDRVDQLLHRFDLGLLVHRDENIELIFNVGDEIEHRQAVPLQILGKAS